MAGAVLHIDTQDLKGVVEKFDRLGRHVQDVSPLMDEIGSMLVASTQDRFERGVDPQGNPWTPWAESTEKRRAHDPDAKILILDNYLAGGIDHQPGNDQVEVGSNKVYAAIHQLGGQAGRNQAATIPARPYLGISSEDEREIGNIVDGYLAEALR